MCLTTQQAAERQAARDSFVSKVCDALEQLSAGLDNCIENARIRNDDYDVGYLTAMKRTADDMVRRAKEQQ